MKEELPTIQFLEESVGEYLSGLNVHIDVLSQNLTWNHQFHSLLELVNLQDDFPPCALLKCYRQNKSCGHVLQVDLHNIATNTLYLMLEYSTLIAT